MNAVIPTSALMPDNMDSAFKLAEMMSRGKLVPSHLQSSPGDCLMVIELAMRLGMSPFAVAQSTSVISGKLMLEGKLVGAALNASGIMSSRLTYKHMGEGPSRSIVVTGTLRGETEPRSVSLTLQEAKTSNGMWTKQPDQQLVYAATRVWARRHAPEVMLGVYAPEEFDQQPPHPGVTIDHEPTPPPPPPAQESTPPKRTWAVLLDEIEVRFRDAATAEAVDALIASDEVQKAMDGARNGARTRLTSIVKAAVDRTKPKTATPPAAVEDPIGDGGWPSLDDLDRDLAIVPEVAA